MVCIALRTGDCDDGVSPSVDRLLGAINPRQPLRGCCDGSCTRSRFFVLRRSGVVKGAHPNLDDCLVGDICGLDCDLRLLSYQSVIWIWIHQNNAMPPKPPARGKGKPNLDKPNQG